MKKLQYLGKFIQEDALLPSLNSFLNSKREFYDVNEIIKAELICLKLLRYKLNSYSAYSVMKYFLNNGIVDSENLQQIKGLYSLSFIRISFKYTYAEFYKIELFPYTNIFRFF